jgi:predicted Rossmann-fold nucleotide-binding protein
MQVDSATGYIARNPNNSNGLALAFPIDYVEKGVLERMLSPDPSAFDTIAVLGRSALAQLGLDIRTHLPIREDSNLLVPITPISHTKTASQIIEDVQGLPSDEHGLYIHGNDKLAFASLLDESGLKKLNAEEMEQAIRDKLIMIGDSHLTEADERDWTINPDGSVTLPLAMLEFLFNHDIINTPEKRFRIINHGRSGLRPYVDTAERDPDESLSPFTVSGALFSSGPFAWKIRPSISDGQYAHLESALFGDGDRLMGIGGQISPYERHRQLELAWAGNGNHLTYSKARVTVDFYDRQKPQIENNRLIDWSSLSDKARARLHSEGIDPLKLISAYNTQLLAQVYTMIRENDLNAVVITGTRVTGVPVAETNKFNAQGICTALEGPPNTNRTNVLDNLYPLSKQLAKTSDRSRVVIADTLHPEHVPRIVDEGDVKGVVVRDWGSSALSKEEHSALVGLVRRGTSIGWQTEGKLLQMHKSGLWVKPNMAERLAELELVFAMYGSHKEVIGEALSKQIRNFVKSLGSNLDYNRDNLAIAHGNGPGVMNEAHSAAVLEHLMSIGVAIDVENLGQGQLNFGPDAVAFFKSQDRLYRQLMLDVFNTISIFNIGGFGSLEEIAITMTTQKLYESLPTPKILIQDEPPYGVSRAAHRGVYSSIPELVSAISDTNEIVIAGQVIDLKDSRLGPKWISPTLHLVDSYDEAFEIIVGFLNNPAAYWEKAGISQRYISLALHNQTKTLESIGFNPDTRLARAGAKYAPA